MFLLKEFVARVLDEGVWVYMTGAPQPIVIVGFFFIILFLENERCLLEHLGDGSVHPRGKFHFFSKTTSICLSEGYVTPQETSLR